jgi:hypothetical protein
MSADRMSRLKQLLDEGKAPQYLGSMTWQFELARAWLTNPAPGDAVKATGPMTHALLTQLALMGAEMRAFLLRILMCWLAFLPMIQQTSLRVFRNDSRVVFCVRREASLPDTCADLLSCWCCPVRARRPVRYAPAEAVTQAHLIARFAGVPRPPGTAS